MSFAVMKVNDSAFAGHVSSATFGMPAEEMKAAYANMIKYGPKSVLETVDPEIRPAGAYATPPGGFGGFGGGGFGGLAPGTPGGETGP